MESKEFTAHLEYVDNLRWLMWSLREGRIRRVGDAELVQMIGAEDSAKTSPLILKEIDRRLADWPARQQRILARALERVHKDNRRPGPRAQAIDRVLRRFLWKISTRSARPLALECLESPRLQRRMASWRYLSHQGIEPPDRALLVSRSTSETHKYFWQLVAHDAAVIGKIGLAPAISAQGDSYWRGRVLQTVLASGRSPTRSIMSEYPWETIFAIRRTRRVDLISIAVQLFRHNRSNLRVVSAAIQCFGFLRAHPELEEAEAVALELLKNSPPRVRDLLRLEQSLAEINRFAANPWSVNDQTSRLS